MADLLYYLAVPSALICALALLEAQLYPVRTHPTVRTIWFFALIGSVAISVTLLFRLTPNLDGYLAIKYLYPFGEFFIGLTIVSSFVSSFLLGIYFGKKRVVNHVLELLQEVRRDLQDIERQNPTEKAKGALWRILEIEEDLLVNRERIYRDWSYPGMLRNQPPDPRQQNGE
jgi:hypothetical protein